MRKTIALVLALAQLVFGGVLIANGGKVEKAKKEHRNAILENGVRVLFALEGFTYSRYEEYGDPLWFDFELPDEYYDYDWVYPVSADENGVAVFGPCVKTPETDFYYAPYMGETYFEIDEKTLETLFAGQEYDYEYYCRDDRYPGKSLFKIDGEWKSVYVIGTVWKGDLVVTGLCVDGTEY